MPKIQCKVCKNSFYARPSHLKKGWGKYCSNKCSYFDQRNGKYVDCKTCAKKVYRTPRHFKHSQSGNFFCNKICHAIWKNTNALSGVNHVNWKNGENAYRNIMSRSKRKPICGKCKIKNFRVLLVHHIDHNRKNNILSNLRWLCRNCHYLIHDGKTF